MSVMHQAVCWAIEAQGEGSTFTLLKENQSNEQTFSTVWVREAPPLISDSLHPLLLNSQTPTERNPKLHPNPPLQSSSYLHFSDTMNEDIISLLLGMLREITCITGGLQEPLPSVL